MYDGYNRVSIFILVTLSFELDVGGNMIQVSSNPRFKVRFSDTMMGLHQHLLHNMNNKFGE